MNLRFLPNYIYFQKVFNNLDVKIFERNKEDDFDFQIITHDYPNAFLGKTARNTIKLVRIYFK